MHPLSMDEPLYKHFIVPSFPNLALSASFLTAPGPMRGVATAELAVYHTCVRRAAGLAAMRASTRWHLCHQRLDKFMLFHTKFNQVWPLFLMDAILSGLLPVFSVAGFLVQVLWQGRMDVPPLQLLGARGRVRPLPQAPEP